MSPTHKELKKKVKSKLKRERMTESGVSREFLIFFKFLFFKFSFSDSRVSDRRISSG